MCGYPHYSLIIYKNSDVSFRNFSEVRVIKVVGLGYIMSLTISIFLAHLVERKTADFDVVGSIPTEFN